MFLPTGQATSLGFDTGLTSAIYCYGMGFSYPYHYFDELGLLFGGVLRTRA